MKKLFIVKKLLLIILVILFFASPAWGADYFFSVSGNDNGDADGTQCELVECDDWQGTGSGPCKTVECMNVIWENMSNGDRVLLLEGDEWNRGTLANWQNGSLSDENRIIDLDHSGADGSPRLIGAYDSSGNYVATSSNKPIIDYNGDNPIVYEYGHVLGCNHSSTKVEWITVENLEIRDSGGRAIFFRNRSTGDASGIIVRKNELWDHSGEGIAIAGNSTTSGNNHDGVEISDNVVYDTMKSNGDDVSSCTAVGGAAIHLLYGGMTNALVTRNTIYNTYGEGIGFYWGQNNGEFGTGANIAEYNVVYNSRTAGIHAGESHAIARYNLVGVYDAGGDGYEKYFYDGTWPNCGTDYATYSLINMNSTVADGDGPPDSVLADSKFEIYGNLLFGNAIGSGYGYTSTGISCSYSGTQGAGNDTIECRIYNNTIVDCEANFSTNNHGNDDFGLTSYVKNNISVFYDGSGDHGNVANPSGNIEYDYNLYSSTPDNSNMQGVNDIKCGGTYSCDPLLTRITGYQWPTDMVTIKGSDFNLKNDSPAKHRGVSNPGYDERIIEADFNSSPIFVDLGTEDTPPSVGAWGHPGRQLIR